MIMLYITVHLTCLDFSYWLEEGKQSWFLIHGKELQVPTGRSKLKLYTTTKNLTLRRIKGMGK